MTHDAQDELEIAHVQPYQAVKIYRCPGCDHEIALGLGHEVVMPKGVPARAAPLAHRVLASRRAPTRRQRPLTPSALRRRPRARRSPGAVPGTASTDATSKRSSGARYSGCSASQRSASVRIRRCLVTVTASNGAPNAVLRRVLTSQNTTRSVAREHEVELPFATAPVAVEQRVARVRVPGRDRVLPGHPE